MTALIGFSTTQVEDILRVEQISNDLFKLSLSRRNKSAIFSEAIERLNAGREEADLVLRNLQAWCPETAAYFRRRTSEIILDTPFRLLCSSPTGIPFDGAFVIRQYLAVSYSWHNPTWSTNPSYGAWPVGGRFAVAILAQRGHPREGVWIDQVCINQRDEEEKQRAIACMDIIYRSCRHKTLQSKQIDSLLASLQDRTSPLLDDHNRKAGAITASFVARFNSIAQTGCLLPGDRLSVYLNLTGLSLAYFRSTEPTANEVYYLAAILSLAAGEKTALTFAKSIHSVSVHRLEIDLVFFENPSRECTVSELSATYAIFPDAIKSTPTTLKTQIGQPSEDTSDKDLEEYRRRFLAAVLAGGHSLAGRLWAQIDQEILPIYNRGLFEDFAANKDLQAEATVFMDVLTKNGPKNTGNSHGITEEAALALLTWITDPRSFYWTSVLPEPITFPNGADGPLVISKVVFHAPPPVGKISMAGVLTDAGV
ncbi:hypothetical protein EsH8_X_000655 [Colletotrichum jinshuiense]